MEQQPSPVPRPADNPGVPQPVQPISVPPEPGEVQPLPAPRP
jgi:hypothetical protein